MFPSQFRLASLELQGMGGPSIKPGEGEPHSPLEALDQALNQVVRPLNKRGGEGPESSR